MATDYIWVQGKCKWARVFPQNMDKGEYGEKYTIVLYPTDKSIASLKNAGFKGEFKKDEDGIFVKFTRKPDVVFGDEKKHIGPPTVTNKDAELFTEFIGNGSEVGVLLEIYDTKKYGKGTRLKEVRVMMHVPYEKKDEGNSIELPPLLAE